MEKFRIRRILRLCSLLACTLTIALLVPHHKWDYDVMIINVRYLHGNEFSKELVSVGITRGRISFIGRKQPPARMIISGDGILLAPGLIDVNSCGWLGESAADLKLRDGVTTFFNAHGDSFNANAQKIHASEKLNYATSVGLLPAFANHLSIAQMKAALEESLRYGAYTISLSPEYTAETTAAIVTELSNYFAHKSVLFTFHLRYSSESEELVGVHEAVACAEQGNPVHILHITSTGATFHPLEAKGMIDAATSSGMSITYDFYPYTQWTSSIHRSRFTADWQHRYNVNFSQVRIFGEENLTLDRFEKLKSSSQERNVIVDSIPQATVDYFATNSLCPIGTDSEANPETTHPRGAGSFTKFVNDYVDTGKVAFAQAIYRFSTATAKQFAPYIPQLERRGAVELGFAADLILWDRAKIKSRSDFVHPLDPSSGVVAAFVNGVPLILNGKTVNAGLSPGRHLKGVWATKP